MGRAKGTKNTPRAIIDEIVRKHKEQGVSIRELAIEYNKTYKSIDRMLARESKRRKMMEAGDVPRRIGRPCKNEGELPPSIRRLDKLAQMRYVLASRERYIKRLEMENELLRDFLLHTERM